ncbi:MAG TPA: hypothetical protein PK867_26200 [Pirellulales bacterium]|nr:hypothetical protein [Pirellulales bacterium]
MARSLSVAVLLSFSLLAGGDAWAQQAHRGPHFPHLRAGQFPAGNQAGFGGQPFFGAPFYGPAYGIGYMPVYGFAPSGFVGGYGPGGFSTTFAAPSFGGQNYFGSPAYGHWGGFGNGK